MKYAVDSIVDDIVLLEELTTKEKKWVDIIILPENIKEGSIISYENKKYILDLQLQKTREQIIKEKLERLKKH